MWQLWLSSVSSSAIISAQASYSVPKVATGGIFGLDDGMWTWFNGPETVKSGDHLYATMVDSSSPYSAASDGVVVAKLNTVTGCLESRVETELLGFNGGGDDHNNGALLLTASGVAISSMAGHPSTGLYVGRSTDGDFANISSWANINGQTGTSSHTYANLYELNGNVYLFTRVHTTPFMWAYTKSTDDGANWSADVPSVQGNQSGDYSCYMIFYQRSSTRLDFLVTDGHPRTAINNVYHGYFDATTDTFHQSDGTAVDVSGGAVTPASFTQVYDGSSTNAWLWELNEFNGELYGLISIYPDYITVDWADHRYYRVHFNGTTWSGEEVCEAGIQLHPGSVEEQYSGGVCFHPDTPDTVFACYVDPTKQWSDLRKYERQGAADWTWTHVLATDVNRGFKVARPMTNGTDFITAMAGDYSAFNTAQMKAFSFHKNIATHGRGQVSARAWRIAGMGGNKVPANMQLGQVEFRETVGGVDFTDAGPGSAISSSEYSGSHIDDQAFDGNTSTRWAALGWFDQWVGWDAGDGNSFIVSEVAVHGGTVPSECPTYWLLEYSDDLVDWTPYCLLPGPEPRFSRAPTDASGWNYYEAIDMRHYFVPNPQSKAYRHVRFDFIEAGENGGSGSSWIVQKIKIRDNNGDNMVIDVGGFDRWSNEQTSNAADHAFLDDTQIWFSYATQGMHYLEWDFGEARSIKDVQIQCRNGSPLRDPRGFLIRGSNNGIQWDTLAWERGLAWVSDETKTFEIAQAPNTVDSPEWVMALMGPPQSNMHQGVIARTDGYTLVDDNQLTRYDLDWVQQAINSDPKGDMSTSGNMIDPCEYGDYIRMVRERDLGAGGHYIEAWHKDTLVYTSAESVALTAGPNFVGFSTNCLGPETGVLYGVSENASVIEKYSISTGAHLGDIPIGGTLSQCNGIHYREDYFYFACRPNTMYRCYKDGGVFEAVLTMGTYDGMDGLSGLNDDLYLLCETGWDGVFKVVPHLYNAVQTTGQTSGNFISNGDFETQDTSDWLVWPGSTGFSVTYGGAVGATPDSYIAQGIGAGAFMLQCYEIPEEAWDSVDAGTATVDLSYNQFGSGTGAIAVTCFNGHFQQLDQYGYTLTAPGWTAWQTRGLTAQSIPAGTRMLFVQVHGSGTTTYFDEITCSFSW